MQALHGDKYDVSTVILWVWQFKHKELEEASLYDKAWSGSSGWNSKTLT
jgi:hypothetical protein